MSDNDQGGRIVLVTGGGHGIGRGIAEAFGATGAAVMVADRTMVAADEVAAAITAAGGTALAVALDVREAASVRTAVDHVVDRFGRVDVLVNNAGIYPNTPFLEMAQAEWDAVFDTNVRGIFLVSQAVATAMVAQGRGGRIINISSGAAESGRAGASHYCSTKAAVNMLTRVMALELSPHGITVNAVAPGLIEVPDWDLSQQYIDAILAATPAGRLGQPSDVANVVLFLASPAAEFVTGSVYGVDGGAMAGRSLPLSSQRAARQCP